MNLKCLKCGSEDVFQKQDGSCLCGACGHRFMPQQEPAEFVPMRLFISYGHKESEICRRIYQALKDRGHDPWFDERRICFGNDWRERIANGIEKSGSVVACLSQYSMREKGVCLDELAISVGVKGGNIVSILLEDVNPPASVSHKQWLDMRGWKEKLDSGEDVFQPWFDAKMAELYAVLESKENREFSGQITELKKRLTVYYSTSRQEKLLRNAFIGREWVDAAVSRWLQDDSAPRTCLLTGAPGVGKSAYAAHFTHYNGSVAAALFCSSDMNTFNDPRTIIQTVAYLMACRLPAYRQSLMLHLPEDRAAVERLSEKELFEQLISKPLSLSVDGNHERMVILLDGLDECGSPEQNVLAKTLDEFAPSLPDWLRILIVARDIPAISVYTKGAYRIEIGSESENNLEDIREYYRFELESKFGDDPHWDDALERMTARSQGIFLYAQMLTDLLRSRGTLGAVEEYPDGLDAVFTSWFGWFFSDSDFRSFWRPAISCILGAPAPLPAETLRRVMHWGENELADFRARLKVLLRVEKNEFDEETLVFDHAFVREWLTRGAGENVYFCSPKDGAEKLTAELFSIFEDSIQSLTYWETIQLTKLPLAKEKMNRLFSSYDFVWRIIHIGEYHRHLSQYSKAENVYCTALTISEHSMIDDAKMIEAYILECLANIKCWKGCYQSAESYIKRSIVLNELKEDSPASNALILSRSHATAGDIFRAQNELNDSRIHYETGLEIASILLKRFKLKSVYDSYCDCLNGLASIDEQEGKIESAIVKYNKILSVRKQLLEENDSLENKYRLMISLHTKVEALKESKEVLRMEEHAITLAQELITKEPSLENRKWLVICLIKKGRILKEQGLLEEAKSVFEEAYSISKNFINESNLFTYVMQYIKSSSELADVYEQVGDIEHALNFYEQLLPDAMKLANSDALIGAKTWYAKTWYASILYAISCIKEDCNDFKSALHFGYEGLNAFEKLRSAIDGDKYEETISIMKRRIKELSERVEFD